MSDLGIALIMLASIAVLGGYMWLCDRVRR